MDRCGRKEAQGRRRTDFASTSETSKTREEK